MSDKSKISWTDATWPVTTGCAIVSAGCANCYALRLSATRMKNLPAYAGVAEMRTRENGTTYPVWTGVVHLAHDRLDWPKRWTKPRMVFVASMSDLFWEQVPFEFIDRVFDTMESTPRHTFQILTKRPERMRDYLRERWATAPPPKHIWLGTSVENQRAADERIPALIKTPAYVRFLSCEPLLGSIDLDPWLWDTRYVADGFGDVEAEAEPADLLHWIIAGGESGPDHRAMDIAWARRLRDQCQAAEVAFWFKQQAAARSEVQPYLDGFKWTQYPHIPVHLQPPTPWGSCAGEDITEAFAVEALF